MAVRCRHFAMRHHHFDLAAQRAFVEAHRLGAVAVEEKVSTDGGHRLLLSGWISARRSAWRDVRAGPVPARAVPASYARRSRPSRTPGAARDRTRTRLNSSH